eukprot:m.171544 g.171544  ORF g.171544 m.171544 type:complete len:558 (+) comp14552_c0_seq3:726-2399(+)
MLRVVFSRQANQTLQCVWRSGQRNVFAVVRQQGRHFGVIKHGSTVAGPTTAARIQLRSLQAATLGAALLARTPLLEPAGLSASQPQPLKGSPTAGTDSTTRQAQQKKEPTLLERVLGFAHMTARVLRHCFVFLPVCVSVPFVWVGAFLSDRVVDWWWSWLLWSVERSGPTFIKFVQWMSSRRDLFSEDTCNRCSRLHASVRTHTLAETEDALKRAFGEEWKSIFRIEDEPIGSGCVAQVYKAQLINNKKEDETEEKEMVAIKVIHPRVKSMILDDLRIFHFVTGVLELVPYFQWLGLSDSVGEFEKLMLQQLDLRREALNMQRFAHNFRNEKDVVVPEVYTEFVRESVLVESFEGGPSVKSLFDSADPICSHIGKRAVQIFFKMVFKDNFVHGDLHPGNLHLRGVDENGKPNGEPIKFVLLDGGIVTHLGDKDLVNFVELFYNIIRGHSREAASLMLERAPHQECANPELFVSELSELIDATTKHGLNLRRVRIGELLSRVMMLACKHRIRLESSYTAVMIGVMVAEGVGRTLDPDLDLLTTAMPFVMREMRRLVWG